MRLWHTKPGYVTKLEGVYMIYHIHEDTEECAADENFAFSAFHLYGNFPEPMGL